MNAPAVKDRMQELGVDLVAPERRSPEYLQKFVESEITKWADPIKAWKVWPRFAVAPFECQLVSKDCRRGPITTHPGRHGRALFSHLSPAISQLE
jgi:hypothetical protein